MPASRSVVSVLLRSWETLLYTLKAGPAGGLRPPSGPATRRRPPGYRPYLGGKVFASREASASGTASALLLMTCRHS